MSEVTHDDLEVCQDCAQVIANGEVTLTGEDGYYNGASEIVTLWDANGWADMPGDFVLTEYDHTGFSWAECDACGTRLGGDRYLAARIV